MRRGRSTPFAPRDFPDRTGTSARARVRAAVRAFAGTAAVVLAACTQSPPAGYQGYVEGEFVNVASPIAGRLDQLSVKRGDAVAVDARLYALEAASEAAAQRQAAEQLKAAEAQLADLKQGRRLPEQDVTRAQLAQAEAEEKRSATQLARDEAQLAVGGIARAQLDDARAAHAVNVARVAQLRSELAVARLPSRERPGQGAGGAGRGRARGARAGDVAARPEVGARDARGPRVRHDLSRRRVGGGRQPGRAPAAAAEREGALLRARGDRRRARDRPRGDDPVRRLRRRHPGHARPTCRRRPSSRRPSSTATRRAASSCSWSRRVPRAEDAAAASRGSR